MIRSTCTRWITLALVIFITDTLNAGATLFPDITYCTIPGVDPNLLCLDVYVPDGADGSNPVMMMIHGGSWISGDKRIAGVVHPKMDYYTDRGWVFISINYRLTITDPPLPIDHPDQVSHPDHIDDTAAAIAWTVDNIATYGGDPQQLVLMGFSAGAHLVALAGTDETRLAAYGLTLHTIDGVIALDGLYDVPLRYTQFPPPPTVNELIWGADLATQQDFSPTTHVASGQCTPPTLVIHADSPNNIIQSGNFVGLLQAAGHEAMVFNAVGLSHTQIGSSIGIPGHVLTVLVDDFLATLATAEVVGDLNCDGLLSVGDIGPFVLALTDPAGYAGQFPDCDVQAADTNCDGIVSVGDIGPFVRLLAGPS